MQGEVLAKHPPWLVCRCAQGVYYSHEQTGETTWQQPPELVAVLGAAAPAGMPANLAPAGMPGGMPSQDPMASLGMPGQDPMAAQQMQQMQLQQQQAAAQAAQQAAYAQMQQQQQAAQMAQMQQMQMMQMMQMQQQPAAMFAPQPQLPMAGGFGFGAPAVLPNALAAPAGRQAGSLKKFFEEKGFGFIQCDDSAHGDVFVHFSQVQNGVKDDMVEGIRLDFDMAPDDKSGRLKAINVKIEGK